MKAECIHREAQACFPKDKGTLMQEWNKFAGTRGGGGHVMTPLVWGSHFPVTMLCIPTCIPPHITFCTFCVFSVYSLYTLCILSVYSKYTSITVVS